MFLTGKRPADLAVAGIGVATFTAHRPEKFEELWRRMPEHLIRAAGSWSMTSSFLERLGELQKVEAAAICR